MVTGCIIVCRCNIACIIVVERLLSHHPAVVPTSETTPLAPSLFTTPAARPSFFSISASVIFFSSRIISSCLKAKTSMNFLPPPPSYLTLENSTSASLASCSLAVNTSTAGFCEGSGKTCCWGFEGLVEGADEGEGGKWDELESVDEGWTGPRDRREAAK